ncbi:MAG: hypothetical protein CM15mP65_18430 [Crocinitomicaceae bacterium]|nr:MAG: hypothetical protein CM15mP65_18430 [Crocinitomicaceae bacterium]
MLKIVVFIDWYKPAYKAGGPISSIYNLIELLGDEMEFYVVTSDRDLNEKSALEGLKYNQWVVQGKVKVRYLSKNQEKRRFLIEIIEQLSPDRIYLNGVFSYFYSVLPLFLFRNYPIIISPRGMLISEALKNKSFKKRCFLLVMKLVKGYRNVIWQFSNKKEYLESQKSVFIKNYYTIPNLTKRISVKSILENSSFELISVCRVNEIKNIHFFLIVLKEVDFECNYTIVGSIEDEEYYNKIKGLIRELPPQVSVQFVGPKPYYEIEKQLAHSSLFISTSRNENYGHSIIEALGNGIPVLVSKACPWNQLESFHAGYRLPFIKSIFLEKLKEFNVKSKEEKYQYKKGARAYYQKFANPINFKNSYIELFEDKA